MENERLYTPSEVSELLQVSRRTLEDWRAKGRGPPFVRIERGIRYPGAKLEAYINGWRAVSRLKSEVGNESSGGNDD